MESTPDHTTLTCADARELLSAAADDELAPGERPRLAAHVESCAACTEYADRLAALTRGVRLRAVTIDHPVAARVLARPARLGRGGWLRPALAWCGLVIAAQSVRPLVLGEVDGTPTHIARHVGASGLALAIGLVYVAWRPNRAFGLLPLVTALFVTTSMSAILDAVDGVRSATAESVHLAEFMGMALLWMVAGSPGWERCREGGRAVWSSVRRGGGVAGSTS